MIIFFLKTEYSAKHNSICLSLIEACGRQKMNLREFLDSLLYTVRSTGLHSETVSKTQTVNNSTILPSSKLVIEEPKLP